MPPTQGGATKQGALCAKGQLMPGYSHDQTNVGGEGGFYCQMLPLPLYFGGSGRKTHPSDVPLQSRGFLASRAQDVIRHATNLVGWEQSPVPPVAEPSSSSVPTRARWPPCEHGLCVRRKAGPRLEGRARCPRGHKEGQV